MKLLAARRSAWDFGAVGESGSTILSFLPQLRRFMNILQHFLRQNVQPPSSAAFSQR